MANHNFLRVHEVPEDQRIWVVRAESGRYHAHFRLGGLIALGHLDELDLPETGSPYNPDFEQVKIALAKAYRDRNASSAQVSALANQAKRFVQEMAVGDLVVTPGPEHTVSFGRITGAPVIDRTPIYATHDESSEPTPMHFSLRRTVAWGPLVRRQTFPVNVTKSLRANQTVFNVDDHWRALHHLIYPFFYYDGTYYFSIRVNQDENISAFAIADLTSLLVKAEALATYIINNNKFDPVAFSSFSREFATTRSTLSMQAQFMSKGDMNFSLEPQFGVQVKAENVNINLGGKITDISLGAAIILLTVSSIIYGNDILGVKGVTATSSTPTKEIDNKITGEFIDDWKSKGGANVAAKLKLGLPEYDTKPLENSPGSSIRDKQIQSYIDSIEKGD